MSGLLKWGHPWRTAPPPLPFLWSALKGTRSPLNKQRALAEKGWQRWLQQAYGRLSDLCIPSPASPPPTPALSSGLILHTGGHCFNAKTTSCVFAFTRLCPVQPFSPFSLQSCSFFVFLVNEHSVFWLTIRPFSLLGFNGVCHFNGKMTFCCRFYCNHSFFFIFLWIISRK